MGLTVASLKLQTQKDLGELASLLPVGSFWSSTCLACPYRLRPADKVWYAPTHTTHFRVARELEQGRRRGRRGQKRRLFQVSDIFLIPILTYTNARILPVVKPGGIWTALPQWGLEDSGVPFTQRHPGALIIGIDPIRQPVQTGTACGQSKLHPQKEFQVVRSLHPRGRAHNSGLAEVHRPGGLRVPKAG